MCVCVCVVCRFCFIKLSLLLIAIEARNEDGTETSISINPGHELKLDSNSQGFFIAESADDVKRCVLCRTRYDAQVPLPPQKKNSAEPIHCHHHHYHFIARKA